MNFEEFRGRTDVSRETFDDLCTYAALLSKWTKTINLVAPSTIRSLWSRHILDSLQLNDMAPKKVSLWLDLGSGGGLPGVVVAIARKKLDTKFQLVESDKRKAAFLRTVGREIDLRLEVTSKRIEDVGPLGADVISARALAPLARLLAFQDRHSTQSSIGLYPKGATADAEISSALESWSFSCDKLPSATMADSHVLKIGDLNRA